MNIFDKLLVELQNEKVQFFGSLLFPNHFRIVLEGNENLFLCLFVLKNHNFSFFNVCSSSLSQNIEFFFQYSFSGRNYLFSIVYDFRNTKNFTMNSLTTLFPQTKNIENFILNFSPIRFQKGQNVKNYS